MSSDAAAEKRTADQHPRLPSQQQTGNGAAAGAGEGPVPARPSPYGDRRLRLYPNKEHKPDSYDDVRSDYDPCVFSMLERHLPPSLLAGPRDAKVQFMQEVLARYLPDGERTRSQKHKEYKEKIIASYQPLHREIYTINPSLFFMPSFLQAIKGNNEMSFKEIVSEPYPGIYTFPMLQPNFCELLSSEVKNFQKWVAATTFRVMQPSTMNKHGSVLDDFGMEPMLDKIVNEFISPLSKVFFPEVGGSSLDSHHGFIVEYGTDKDRDLGFHVDDSEVTLNVCLGKQFVGGDLFFRGIRCEKHVHTESQPEEVFDYAHVPGQAVLHRGRHRHGARPTTSGYRINLLLWCRSSIFREMRKYQHDFTSWCSQCKLEKKERQRQSVAATKLAFLRREGELKT